MERSFESVLSDLLTRYRPLAISVGLKHRVLVRLKVLKSKHVTLAEDFPINSDGSVGIRIAKHASNAGPLIRMVSEKDVPHRRTGNAEQKQK